MNGNGLVSGNHTGMCLEWRSSSTSDRVETRGAVDLTLAGARDLATADADGTGR